MNIKAIQQAIHENAIAKGFWETEPTFGDLISLCHSELSEALEEYRSGNGTNLTYYSNGSTGGIRKPEGIPTELADCVIRIMDICAHYGIDLETAIIEKHRYNQTRPHRHGGKIL